MTIKLKTEEQIKILCSDDIYGIMQRILMRENKIDRDREHLWTISLDSANKILCIELVSIGSVKATVVEPMEVFSVPLQKRALKIIIIHNHPSGELKPSAADKDMTDQLIQCGLILHVPVLDHLIITEKTYYSFADTGLLEELANSKKYVPEYKIREALKKEVEAQALQKGSEKKAREMARAMKAKGYDVKEIAALTGLTEATIKRIKEDEA
jgi:DNA repair protein RadC